MPDGNFRDSTFCSNDDFSDSDAEILRCHIGGTSVCTGIYTDHGNWLSISDRILADGSPRYSMTSMLVGAIVNTILDPIFIFGLHMGMRGAALATIIGQIVSFCISLRYMFHFKTIRLTKESFHMTGRHIENIFKFGASA